MKTETSPWQIVYTKAEKRLGLYFDGNLYGIIHEDAWDNKTTIEILFTDVINMLNDAYDLAREK